MKIIQIPQTIVVKLRTPTGEVDAPVPFLEFIQQALDSYAPLGKGIRQIRQSAKLAGLIETARAKIEKPDCPEGDRALPLEDADYEVFKAAVEANEWRPALARQVVPYLDALDVKD